MQRRSLLAFFWLALALALAGCGGGNDASTTTAPTRLLAQIKTVNEVVVLPGLRSRYVITPTSTGFTVTDTTGLSSPRTIGSTARLRFSDTSLAFDFEASGGQAYRLYQAAFNRAPDLAGLGYWIKVMDGGASVNDVANAFINSAEYKQAYGTSGSAADIIASYYSNALHRTGDAGGVAFWLASLAQGVTRAQLLVSFSESAENQIGVMPAIRNGIAYREVGVAYAPVANAGPNQDITLPSLVTLDASASLASAGATLSYKWTLTTKPAGSNAFMVLASSANPVFQADLPGLYQATLVVNDGVVDSEPAKVNFVAIWKAAAGIVPASGNYVYLESQLGDYIGLGRSYLYSPASATLSVTASGTHVGVSVAGDKSWNGDFQMPSGTATKVQPGYYTNLTRYPFSSAVTGGLSWSGDGRGCNTLTGWFYVDKVSYTGDTLTAIDLRFEQHCEGGSVALRGQIHWNLNDVTAVPGPVLPIPATLWAPSAALLPASGNYAYLDSTSGDYIGGGKIYSYTSPTSPLTVSANGAHLSVSVAGWSADFVGMNTLTRLQPGYYGGLVRYPFNNAVKGGLDWSGQGRGCNTLSGWFAVDSVTYSGLALTAIDLRFEQHCEGGTSALRGKIHWAA